MTTALYARLLLPFLLEGADTSIIGGRGVLIGIDVPRPGIRGKPRTVAVRFFDDGTASVVSSYLPASALEAFLAGVRRATPTQWEATLTASDARRQLAGDVSSASRTVGAPVWTLFGPGVRRWWHPFRINAGAASTAVPVATEDITITPVAGDSVTVVVVTGPTAALAEARVVQNGAVLATVQPAPVLDGTMSIAVLTFSDYRPYTVEATGVDGAVLSTNRG